MLTKRGLLETVPSRVDIEFLEVYLHAATLFGDLHQSLRVDTRCGQTVPIGGDSNSGTSVCPKPLDAYQEQSESYQKRDDEAYLTSQTDPEAAALLDDYPCWKGCVKREETKSTLHLVKKVVEEWSDSVISQPLYSGGDTIDKDQYREISRREELLDPDEGGLYEQGQHFLTFAENLDTGTLTICESWSSKFGLLSYTELCREIDLQTGEATIKGKGKREDQTQAMSGILSDYDRLQEEIPLKVMERRRENRLEMKP